MIIEWKFDAISVTETELQNRAEEACLEAIDYRVFFEPQEDFPHIERFVYLGAFVNRYKEVRIKSAEESTYEASEYKRPVSTELSPKFREFTPKKGNWGVWQHNE